MQVRSDMNSTPQQGSCFNLKLRPASRRSRHCWTTSRVNMLQLTAGVHFLGGRLPCLLSGRAHRDGPSLTRQEFAEECDINVLMAYGRCLRPALYSSLRSSPSHPTGVSALRVTIAIANARFARKQSGLRKSTAKSRRLFRNESATSRRVRAGAIGGSTAMTRTAFCRKSPRVPRVCWLGSWALGTSDRGGQDKSRKVRTVGWVRNRARFSTCRTRCEYLVQLAFCHNALSSLCFQQLRGMS